MSRFVVIVPLRKGMRDHARLLIEQGPPFDLTQTALASHEVFLTDQEAVFVFEGTAAKEAVERLSGEPGVWRSATAWNECLAGRPRFAKEAFSWIRQDEH